MDTSKMSYQIITDLWKLLKKYIPLALNADDKTFTDLWEESNAIYDSTKDMPEYYREGVSMMIRGALGILDGMYKEEHNGSS